MRARERLLRVWRWASRFLLWVVLPASLAFNYYTIVFLPERPDMWRQDKEFRVTIDGRKMPSIPVYRNVCQDHQILVHLEPGRSPWGFVASDDRLGVGGPICPAPPGWVVVEGSYRFLPYTTDQTMGVLDSRYKQGSGWFEFLAMEGKYKGHRVRVESSDTMRFP
jgi:hypothetical protein